MWNRRELLLRSAGLSALAGAGLLPRLAQAEINGTATIVSGFPAGGMGDNVARPIAEKLRGHYASSVVVDARTGAGGLGLSSEPYGTLMRIGRAMPSL